MQTRMVLSAILLTSASGCVFCCNCVFSGCGGQLRRLEHASGSTSFSSSTAKQLQQQHTVAVASHEPRCAGCREKRARRTAVSLLLGLLGARFARPNKSRKLSDVVRCACARQQRCCSASRLPPVTSREMKELCDLSTTRGIAGGYFDGPRAWRIVIGKLKGGRRTEYDKDYYRTAERLQRASPLSDGCTGAEYSKKAFEQRATDAGVSRAPDGGPPPLGAIEQLCAGSFAAFAAWVIGYPADVIKTRCQV